MKDLCDGCSAIHDIEKCVQTTCTLKNAWYVKVLKSEIDKEKEAEEWDEVYRARDEYLKNLKR